MSKFNVLFLLKSPVRYQVLILPGDCSPNIAMKGAIIAPTLAIAEAIPRAEFLTLVAKISLDMM